ncbi:MAG: sporulation transcriptional regulator SpoIIID [Oscillospiraceae bacterium]|nr:sporulation transcriptional regulator SpoIIID [Oscillospiraceae bacterium]MBQ2791900.1 sporulation transcriptional regulator SpoIIID [Oscillospiraceae bacterium]MBQ3242207.1 sporulation transcriptional regulator SpoIIID [Oscillospiraceae bacterium]MBR2636232.1 sporulation transcriptional regulator SpoIIID [Oscillospiraceae bacterium]MBR6607772.1 sporulation transcriptional regulator SpoIIID [Oscillospiraceae bacterium]
MKGMPEERAVALGLYMIENGATVRSAAKAFRISKSTVHKDVTQRLRKMDPTLYRQVKALLDQNKQERHIRGGAATKEKYAQKKKKA